MLGRRTMVVFVALAATLVSAGAYAASTATITIQDAVGDATVGAPDIRSASIRDNGRGTLTFSVDLVGRTELVPDDQLRIYLDTDNNPATGDDDGIDYLIFADASARELKLFVASAVIETDTGVLVYEGTVRCAATIGGRKVKPARRGQFIKLINVGQSEPADADASCAWNIPPGTAGKTIRGTITVTSQGMSVRKSFAARIVR